MDKPTRYRDLLRLVAKYGIAEDPKRGKGSERLWVQHRPNGSKIGYPVTCHGLNSVVGVGLIKAIRRRFHLTPKDGISDEEFYSRK